MLSAILLAMAAAPASGQAAEPPAAKAPPASGSADQPVDWDKEFAVAARTRDPATGEFPVEPYVTSNSNAGARQFAGTAMAAAFGGQDGIRRIAARTIDLSEADPRIAPIFVSQDLVRLRRTLGEQFCFILNAGCNYSGRTMHDAHAALGVRRSDLNALVEHLQAAMREAKVPFAAQNRFLAKLAPMDRQVVTR